MFSKRTKKDKESLIEGFGRIKDEEFDFDSIERYFKNKDNSSAFQVISDKTCNDIDFHELFMFLDRTSSKVGQQYLYNKLRTVSADRSKVENNEQLINEFLINDELRIKTQLQLSKLNDSDSFYLTSLFQDKHIEPPKWFSIAPFLSFSSALIVLLSIIKIQIILLLPLIIIVNLIIHYWNKKNLQHYLYSMSKLLIINSVAKNFFAVDKLKTVNPDLHNSIKIIDSLKRRMAFFSFENKIISDLDALFYWIIEFVKITFLLEPILLFNVLKRIETKKSQIEDVFKYVGKVDCFISIASLRKGVYEYCIPNIFSDSIEIVAEQVYHPLIIDCVRNSINTNSRSVLLTGSNMSGKSSFIRTIAVNALTALTLNTCFAKSFALPLLKIHSAIRISDDLMNDKSYYFEEVLTIKEMIGYSQTDSCHLFLLDEIFKGTNTVERISAGKAVLSALQNNSNIVFVSTHDIELAELLKHEYDLYHFSEKINFDMVDFDYKLKSGKLKNRNAIRILEINGYPIEVIEEAIVIAKKMDAKEPVEY